MTVYSVPSVPIKGGYIMFSERDREEIEEMVDGQLEVVKTLVDKTLDSGIVLSIARLYRAMFSSLCSEGFSREEAMMLLKSKDLVNINKGE